MTWTVVDDGDGSPRIVIAEPAGSTAVVSSVFLPSRSDLDIFVLD